MKQPYMVAHILQLTQIVAGNHHRRAVLRHKIYQKLLHQFPHHRVQAVKNFVKQDTARLGGQPQQDRRLALHALTHLAQPSVKGNGKQLFHPGKVVLAPPGIHAAVQPCQPPHGGGGSKIRKVRDKHSAALDLLVLKRRLAVNEHPPAVRPIHTGQNAQQRGLTGTVRAYQPKNGAVLHLQRQVAQGGNAVKLLAHILNFNHLGPSSPSVLLQFAPAPAGSGRRLPLPVPLRQSDLPPAS